MVIVMMSPGLETSQLVVSSNPEEGCHIATSSKLFVCLLLNRTSSLNSNQLIT